MDNNQLRLKALGNTNDYFVKSYWVSMGEASIYQYMPSEVQKAARSDQILVKNVVNAKAARNFLNSNGYLYNNGKLIYTNGKGNNIKGKIIDVSNIYDTKEKIHFGSKIYEPNDNQVKAMLLRANVLAQDGYINEPSRSDFFSGSSFSTPRIARVAWEVKNKFPWMSYNQIKQTLLTSSDSNYEYLDDYLGWGVVNKRKALRGPSDFNAGLIDEQKYFKGWIDATRNNKGDYFFYANIDKNEKTEFSNNISSGLTGDGKTQDYKVVSINGANNKTYLYKIPKVLDSERLFYSNVKKQD